jgi:hypothetical protein
VTSSVQSDLGKPLDQPNSTSIAKISSQPEVAPLYRVRGLPIGRSRFGKVPGIIQYRKLHVAPPGGDLANACLLVDFWQSQLEWCPTALLAKARGREFRAPPVDGERLEAAIEPLIFV